MPKVKPFEFVRSVLQLERVPDIHLQERERAKTRAFVWIGICAVWLLGHSFAQPLAASTWAIFLFGSLYLALTLIHSHFTNCRHPISTLVIGASLVIDPTFLIVLLATNPARFALLNPLVLFVIVRSGLRYGIRGMYLSWYAALASTPLLLTSSFWRGNLELLAAFVVLLAAVPVFFSSLVRRVHNARTIEADRARLVAVNEALVARSAFLAKVSHELRSPLQNIISALDLFEMRHGPASQEDQELIGRMRRSSLLLNTQLRDLLTLAKGEAGRLDIRPEPFEACALVEALAESARELAEEKGLALSVHLPDEAVFVVADGARIDQILTNLVINSIRYTERGRVSVTLGAYDPVLRRLHFVVADTGPGIPEDRIPTLFAPDRARASAERRGEGSGMGLAIVRTLMTQLGGTVEVSSRLGRGTTFTLDIPAEPVVENDEPRETEPGAGRVLVVDDREDVLEALVSVVDELGYECDRARTAAIASNLAGSRRYDVILLDLQMPVKGGSWPRRSTRQRPEPRCPAGGDERVELGRKPGRKRFRPVPQEAHRSRRHATGLARAGARVPAEPAGAVDRCRCANVLISPPPTLPLLVRADHS